MNIKFSKNALWLRPYLKQVKDIIPLDKIVSIKGYRVRKGLEECLDGSTHKYRGKYFINIRLWNLNDGGTVHRRGRYEQIVHVLAHELAHIIHFEHPPDHFRLTGRIMMRFARVMSKEGITDTSERFSPTLMKKHIDKEKVSSGR
jgi:hypothetical protein